MKYFEEYFRVSPMVQTGSCMTLLPHKALVKHTISIALNHTVNHTSGVS